MEAKEIWNWTKIYELRASVRLSLTHACGVFADDVQEIFNRVFERIVAGETGMHIERIYKDCGSWIAEMSIRIPLELSAREVIENRLNSVIKRAREQTREAVRLKTLLSIAFSQKSETGAREVMEKVGVRVY